MTERPGGATERGEGTTKRAGGMTERGEGMIKQVEGLPESPELFYPIPIIGDTSPGSVNNFV